jgi:hypothetical protein
MATVKWSKDEEGELANVAFRAGGVFAGAAEKVALAVATRAVELAAARGGTMDVSTLENNLRKLECGTATAEMVRQHITALGARNAVLERELLTARKDLDAAAFREANAKAEAQNVRNLWSSDAAEWKALEAETEAERQKAERERDEARAMVSAQHSAVGCPSMHTAQTAEVGCATDAILAARAELQQALADNAALVRAARLVLMDCAEPNGTFKTLIKAVQEMGTVVNQPHPGAALLEQHRKEVEVAWSKAADVVAKRKRTLSAIGIHPVAAGVLDEMEILLRARAARGGEPSTTPLDATRTVPVLRIYGNDGTCTCGHPPPALALIRAKNEGLERAAKQADDEAAEWDAAAKHDGDKVSHEANALRSTARAIRALKEPENA